MNSSPTRTASQPLLQMMSILNQLRRAALASAIAPDLDIGSMTQVATIGYLYHRQGEEVFQKDLEAVFKLRRSTVSSLLSTLEKKGLIRRESVRRDARLKRLSLTPTGMDYCSGLNDFWDTVNRWMTSCLDAQEVASLAAILQKVEGGLETTLDTLSAPAQP